MQHSRLAFSHAAFPARQAFFHDRFHDRFFHHRFFHRFAFVGVPFAFAAWSPAARRREAGRWSRLGIRRSRAFARHWWRQACSMGLESGSKRPDVT
jgi:hypothetical protein